MSVPNKHLPLEGQSQIRLNNQPGHHDFTLFKRVKGGIGFVGNVIAFIEFFDNVLEGEVVNVIEEIDYSSSNVLDVIERFLSMFFDRALQKSKKLLFPYLSG